MIREIQNVRFSIVLVRSRKRTITFVIIIDFYSRETVAVSSCVSAVIPRSFRKSVRKPSVFVQRHRNHIVSTNAVAATIIFVVHKKTGRVWAAKEKYKFKYICIIDILFYTIIYARRIVEPVVYYVNNALSSYLDNRYILYYRHYRLKIVLDLSNIKYIDI